jgi:predicted DNA binding CopG/RHH family protein
MKTQPTAMHSKVTVRLTERQLKTLQKTAKQHKMNVAEYVRACII